jgi:hypothetical protein
VPCVSGFTVRLYGSSASGFGLKKSDVNLELCVPPEKSPSKGLADACDIIASQGAYRYALIVTAFTDCVIYITDTFTLPVP